MKNCCAFPSIVLRKREMAQYWMSFNLKAIYGAKKHVKQDFDSN
jgi:hypothetical protein